MKYKSFEYNYNLTITGLILFFTGMFGVFALSAIMQDEIYAFPIALIFGLLFGGLICFGVGASRSLDILQNKKHPKRGTT